MKSKTNLLIFFSFFIGGLAWGFLPLDRLWAATPPPAVSQQDPIETTEQISTELGTFARLAHELKPSVVNISVIRKLPDRTSVPRQMPGAMSPEASGHGSGVIISSDGDVLTNNHVVDGAKTITVKFADGRELDADIVGTDRKTDLALLKVRKATGLPEARLGDSDALAVGDWVMAIGNPFGLEATVTVGVLSGKGRVIGTGPYDDFLQTDASINPGNSGGPLFNTKGEVIGINTAIVPGGQGIGFSIPINLAKEISSQLQKEGRVVRGFIGVGIQGLTPALKSALSLSEDTSGALVSSIVPGGPGEAAGLQVSDVIVAVDNNRIASDRGLLREVARLPIGSEIPFTVLREGGEETVFIHIIERPDDKVAYRIWPEDAEKGARVGVAVTDVLDPDSIPVVVVTEVVTETPAHRAGLKRGDLIRAVGTNAISSSHEFVREVSKIDGDMALLIEREGRTSYVVIKE
jgi:serine protease Do